MKYQVFSDMDGVLVNFEGGVLRYMNQRLRELKDQPDHPDHKLARSAAKEIGGWDVEIDKWHIARSDQEEEPATKLPVRRLYVSTGRRTTLTSGLTSAGSVAAKNFGIILKIFQVLRFCRLRWQRDPKVGKRMWVERELGVPVEKVNLSDSKKPYGVWKRKTRTSD